jgi:hypothetical protein
MAPETEVVRPYMALFRRAEVPGGSCKGNLAKLATSRTVVPARLPLLRFGPLQIE